VKSDTDRCHAFRQLHASGCFVIPNAWDVGSARVLARLGFAALATTSSGCAWSLGRPDNGVSLDQALTHLRSIVESVDVPVSADFEGAFAIAPAAVAANVARATATGIAGLSIDRPQAPLHGARRRVARVWSSATRREFQLFPRAPLYSLEARLDRRRRTTPRAPSPSTPGCRTHL
jgi:2-methylisocitrate lyase-like PEP mutase family enzyme